MDKALAREVGLNIRRYRLAAGLTESQLAQLMDSAQPVINGIENGKRGCSLDFMEKIGAALKVPIYYFFAPEPLVTQARSVQEPTIIEVFPDEATKLEFNKFRSRDDFLPIRILDDAAALGHGASVSKGKTRGYALIHKQVLPEGVEHQKRDRERVVCLYAEGDSMAPTILKGSLVAVDIEDRDKIRKNKIYAVETPDSSVTMKRVVRADDHLMLFADNPAALGFPTCLSLKSLGYNPICGRMVWAGNKF